MVTVMDVAVFVLAWTGLSVWLIALALLATAAYEQLTRFHARGRTRLRDDAAQQDRARQIDELVRLWEETP